MSIGERISQLRSERNISQNQLAKAMDVSRQAVSKWENGQSTPDPSKMIQLCQVLDTDLEYLTTGRVVVPSRPPVVVEKVKYVDKVVETIVEVPVVEYVDRKVVEYVDRPVIKRLVRTKYVRSPIEFALVGLVAFLLGLLIGLLF